jgi:hypothetical protein
MGNLDGSSKKKFKFVKVSKNLWKISHHPTILNPCEVHNKTQQHDYDYDYIVIDRWCHPIFCMVISLAAVEIEN